MRNKKTIFIKFIIFITIIFISYNGFSENISGIITEEINLRINSEVKYDIGLSTEEISVIYLKKDVMFLKGISLEIIISDFLLKYTNGLALCVYYNITPEPHIGMKNFTGTRAFYSELPYSGEANLNIPINVSFSDDNGILAGDLGSTSVIKDNQFPIIIMIQPVMKGIPDKDLERDFLFTIKPDIAKKGILELSLNKPDGYETMDVQIFLDEKLVSLHDFPMVLDSGIHRIKTNSDVFKEEVVSFAITSGETESVEIVLEPNLTTLIFNIQPPEGSSLYLDGEKIDVFPEKKIELTTGEHTIRLKVGEYSMTKSFVAEAGKSYTLSLILDIDLKEN